MSIEILQSRIKKYIPVAKDYHYSSLKSNQFRGSSSLQVPLFDPDQFKRRQEKEVKSVYQTGSSNQSGRPVSRVMPSERQQFRTQFPSYPWKQAERMSYPVLENQLKDKPGNVAR